MTTSWGSSSSSPFFISCRTRQRARGLLSSSPTKNDNRTWPVIVFLCFIHYLQTMTMNRGLIIEDDDELMFIVIFFLFCLYASGENDDDK
jgi:hypothetical protein